VNGKLKSEKNVRKSFKIIIRYGISMISCFVPTTPSFLKAPPQYILRTIAYAFVIAAFFMPFNNILQASPPTASDNIEMVEDPLLADDFSTTPSWADAGEYNFTKEFIKMLGALGILVAALLGFAFVFKKVIKNRTSMMDNSSNIRVLERRAIAPKLSVYIIDVAGTKIIVGESPAGLQRLGELPKGSVTSDQ
jgi:flagellar biogenesis protein FliO